MTNLYCTPKQLMNEPEVQRIFSRPQEIGMFIRLFANKLIVVDTHHGKLIEKKSFMRVLRAIEEVETRQVVF